MNSSVGWLIFSFLTYSLRGGYLRLKNQYMSVFPIPSTNDEMDKALAKCSTNIDEKLCDELAMNVYNLQPQERSLLADWREMMPHIDADAGENINIEEEDE